MNSSSHNEAAGLKVLFGMPSPGSWGGPVYTERLIVDALRAAGVTCDEESYVYGETDKAPSAPTRISRVWRAASDLRRRAGQERYDVIHLNTSFDEKCVIRDLVTLTMLRRFDVPVYLKMHGSIAGFLKTKSTFWRSLQRMVFERVDGIGVLSTEERDNFIAAGCPAKKLSEARLAVMGKYEIDGSFRQRHGLANETSILLFSSRFVRTKGLLDVISAVGLLARKRADVHLFCLGDGPVRGEAEDLVRKLDLADSVTFTGYIAEARTADFHANADVFVFPTYHDEGFPLVILKSLAAATPIITTPTRAAADHLAEPKNCLWTSPQDPGGLAERILQLIDSPKMRRYMAENNRELAKEFSPEGVAEHYLGIYRSLRRSTR